jgi:hypothetical protein
MPLTFVAWLFGIRDDQSALMPFAWACRGPVSDDLATWCPTNGRLQQRARPTAPGWDRVSTGIRRKLALAGGAVAPKVGF